MLEIHRRRLEAKFDTQKAKHLKEIEDAFEMRVKQEVKSQTLVLEKEIGRKYKTQQVQNQAKLQD